MWSPFYSVWFAQWAVYSNIYTLRHFFFLLWPLFFRFIPNFQFHHVTTSASFIFKPCLCHVLKNLFSCRNMTLSELVNSVIELVQFTGRISTIGLHLEGYNTLLLHFVLSFYETVSRLPYQNNAFYIVVSFFLFN